MITRNTAPSFEMSITRFTVIALVVTSFSASVFSQENAATPDPRPAEKSPPKLSAEMRARYAVAQSRAQQDPEFVAAVKRAEDARRVADKIFFEKLRQAEPELKTYIDYLEQARILRQAAPAAKAPQ